MPLPSRQKVGTAPLTPYLPGCFPMQADFLVSAVNSRSVWVEVTMMGADASADTMVLKDYRERWEAKHDSYERRGIEPVVVLANQITPPLVLASKINEVLACLDLPLRPLPPRAWFECV